MRVLRSGKKCFFLLVLVGALGACGFSRLLRHFGTGGGGGGGSVGFRLFVRVMNCRDLCT